MTRKTKKKRYVLLRGMVVEQNIDDLKMLRMTPWFQVKLGQLPVREGWYDVRLNLARAVHKERLYWDGRTFNALKDLQFPKLSVLNVTHWRGLRVCTKKV